MPRHRHFSLIQGRYRFDGIARFFISKMELIKVKFVIDTTHMRGIIK